MAEDAARREARRRRILQNSEERMKLVHGQTDKLQSNSSDSARFTRSSVGERRDVSDGYDNHQTSSDTKEAQDYGDAAPSATSSLEHPKNTVKISKVDRTGQVFDGSHTFAQTDSGRKVDTTELLKSIDYVRFGCSIVLAFLSRWTLSYGYGLFYFETVFAPFIAVELIVYFFLHEIVKDIVFPSKFNMMNSVFLLCGIQPDLIQTYNKTMAYMTMITEDVTTFLFTFIILSLVW